MRAALFLVLLCIALPCLADTNLYVDASADGTSTTCSSSSPCNSIAAALAVFDNSDDLLLNVATGNYNGTSNTEIIFPAVEVTIIGNEGTIFDCQTVVNNTFAFSASSEFTIEDSTITNCDKGIIFSAEEDDLEVSGTNFNNVNTAITFNGEDITFSNVVINGTYTGLLVTNATTVDISGSTFTGAITSAITFSSASTVESISLSSTDFTATAGVSFTIGSDNEDFTGTISSCDFDNINGNSTAITISNGKWTLGNFGINVCGMAVSYSGSGNYTELDMDDIDVTDCDNGVTFSAPGSIDINGGTYNVTNQAVTITDASTIEIEGSTTIIGATIPINIDVTASFEAEITSVTFEGTGPITVIAGSNTTEAKVEDCTFNTPTGRVIDITGGSWGINNIDVTGTSIQNGNGGAFYFAGASASFAVSDCDIEQSSAGTGKGGAVYIVDSAVAFSSCTFTNCSATTGGAVYASNFAALSFTESTFTSNVATGPGGGMDLETTLNVTNVYVSDTVFTDNTAVTGAAISCCSSSACNITIVKDVDNDGFTLSGNINTDTDGTDVTCTVIDGEFYSAASEPDVAITSSSDWVMWVVIVAVIVVVIVLVVAAGVGAYFYRKRMSYTTVE